jgi:hypothetical protein
MTISVIIKHISFLWSGINDFKATNRILRARLLVKEALRYFVSSLSLFWPRLFKQKRYF